MTVTRPDVYRITNYGGSRVRSARGGYGNEFYAVIGVPPNNWTQAEALGFPKFGYPHVDPSLFYLGTVQSQRVVAEFGPLDWIGEAVYSVSGTFNFGTMLGATNENDIETTEVPKIVSVGGSLPPGFIKPHPPFTIKRHCITKRVTRRATITVDDITAIAADNLGRIYEFAGIEYQLTGAPAWQDASGTVRVETRFRNRAALPGFPVDTIHNDIEIPELPPNGEWWPHVAEGEIEVFDPLATLGLGDNLPWL